MPVINIHLLLHSRLLFAVYVSQSHVWETISTLGRLKHQSHGTYTNLKELTQIRNSK